MFGTPAPWRAATLRGTAHNLSRLPVVAVFARLTPPQTGAELTAEEALLGEPVGMMLSWHPAVVKLIEHCGGIPTSATSYKIPRTPATRKHWAELVSRMHPDVWVTPEGTPISHSTVLEQTKTTPVELPRVSTAGKPGPGRVEFSSNSRTIYLKAVAAPIQIKNVTFTLGQVVRTSLPDAGRFARNLRSQNLAVVDADRPGRFDAVHWMWQRRLTVSTVSNDLGAAAIDVGEFVTAASAGKVSLTQARKVIAGVRGGVQLAVDPLVASALAVVDANPVEGVAGSLVLSPWQERFVAKFLAADQRGLVNVLPPGSGKTGCVLAGFAHLADRDPSHTGLVVAPASTLVQWESEVPRFYPAGVPVVLTDTTDLGSLQTLRPGSVVLASPKLVGEHAEVFKAAQFNSLAVDEGLYLAGASKAARALWEIRRNVSRAVVLTGTPPQGTAVKYGKLLSFALNTARDGSNVPPAVKGFGPWVFGRDEQLNTVLPQGHVQQILLPAATGEHAVHKVAIRRVTALLGKLHASTTPARVATELRTELRQWRLGAGMPLAVISGKSGFSKDVRTELVTSGVMPAKWQEGPVPVADGIDLLGVGPKLDWLITKVGEVLTEGAPTLIFTDSLATVTTLRHVLADPGQVGFLTGEVPVKKRAAIADEFMSGELNVVVASGVGQLGVNLQRASHVIHVDVPASADALAQRAGRALRMGSTHSRVELLVPLIEGTAEAQLWELCSSETSRDVVSLAQLLTQSL